MKTFNIVHRGDFQSEQIASSVKKSLVAKGIEVSDEPDLVIAIGGDGTILQAFRKFKEHDPAYVGIHTGTLGFFADWDKHEYRKLVESIIAQQPTIECYALAKAEVICSSGTHSFNCLNEITIRNERISCLELYINGVWFESMRCDGMVIAAPCGSTGYNKSLAGAVLHPSIECMQVTGKAVIDNVEHRTIGSPFILSKDETIEIYPQDSNCIIEVDGSERVFEDVMKIRATISDKKVSFARYRNSPFWQRARSKFIGK